MAKLKTLVDTVTVSPGEITSMGLNWSDWLAATADTILDFTGPKPDQIGLQVQDSWFTEVSTHLLIGPIPRGRYTVPFDILTEAEEFYHRELRIICR